MTSFIRYNYANSRSWYSQWLCAIYNYRNLCTNPKNIQCNNKYNLKDVKKKKMCNTLDRSSSISLSDPNSIATFY